MTSAGAGGRLLRVEDLHVRFQADEGTIEAVRGVSFTVPHRKTVALVGESGSGKTVISQAILGILPQNARITGGSIHLDDHPKPRAIRGGRN